MRLVPDGQTVPNEVAARFALRVNHLPPGPRGRQDRRPNLVLRVRNRLGGARYVEDAFERVVADQLAFLNRQLKGPNA
jgi:hypothetical protein